MGHIRLGDLPRTRKWSQVVGLIEGGAGTAQIATATINAAEKGLSSAAKDKGVIETIWLLTKLPLCARAENFAEALRDCGLSVSDSPGLVEIVGAMTDAIDAKMPNCERRTDLGEMAQMAAAETLTQVIGERTSGSSTPRPTMCVKHSPSSRRISSSASLRRASSPASPTNA